MTADTGPVTVRLGDRSYPVMIEPGLLDRVGEALAGLELKGTVAVVTQPAVDERFGDRLLHSLETAGFHAPFYSLPDGEDAKTLRQVARLYDFFMQEGVDRWSTVLAFGGGTVGDTAGFAAGTYMRGVPWVQVPTTLVAQVDSSIGGKVAVNFPGAKNLIGLFNQPRCVLADPATLAGIGDRDLKAGLAEVIRSAVIADARFYAWLEGHIEKLLARDEAALLHAIRRAAAIKAAIVSRDETEQGELRALLNYGHTVGHAVEAATGFGRYRHGEAVAVGMAVAARLALEKGLCSAEVMERQISLLKKAGLPVTLRGFSPEKLLNSLMLDKKFRQGRIRFVLTESIGHARVVEGLGTDDIIRAVTAR